MKFGKAGPVQAGHLYLLWKMIFLVTLGCMGETDFHLVVGEEVW